MGAKDGNRVQTAKSDRTALDQDFPASSSQGPTVDEGMMMPEETLSMIEMQYEANADEPSEQFDWKAFKDQVSPDLDKGRMDVAQEYLTRIHKGIQSNPLPFVLCAAGVGFICGRLLGGASRPKGLALQG